MFWQELSLNAPVFFLIFARIFALLSVAPLVGSEAVPVPARVGLTLMISFVVFPVTQMPVPPDLGLGFLLLLVGEVFLGLIYGFMIQLVYAAFQTAGQFFSLQMGLSASMVFDPISQEEVPILGQFFNLGAMFLFLSTDAIQKLFLGGVKYSFQMISALDIARNRDNWLGFMGKGIGTLFQQALILSFPIMGTLLLVSISMGLLAKAAPQMNLLMLGFPISIAVALLIMFLVMPFLLEMFTALIDNAFREASYAMRPGIGP